MNFIKLTQIKVYPQYLPYSYKLVWTIFIFSSNIDVFIYFFQSLNHFIRIFHLSFQVLHPTFYSFS